MRIHAPLLIFYSLCLIKHLDNSGTDVPGTRHRASPSVARQDVRPNAATPERDTF